MYSTHMCSPSAALLSTPLWTGAAYAQVHIDLPCRLAFFRADNDLAQAATRRLPFAVPLGELAGELIAKPCQLLNAVFHSTKMTTRQIQYVRARRIASTTQFQNLTDFIERESKRLRLLDEAQLLDRRLGVPPVPVADRGGGAINPMLS